jgi:hypothetical protein
MGSCIYLSSSSNNSILHNNFIDNLWPIRSVYSRNTWDDGYPSGGNYWTDHNPLDENKDKIGDTPYIMDENNADRYPLIYPFECYEPGYVCSPELNKDGKVNILDITIVARAYGTKPGDPNWNAVADLDTNGIINILDISLVARDYGRTI